MLPRRRTRLGRAPDGGGKGGRKVLDRGSVQGAAHLQESWRMRDSVDSSSLSQTPDLESFSVYDSGSRYSMAELQSSRAFHFTAACIQGPALETASTYLHPGFNGFVEKSWCPDLAITHITAAPICSLSSTQRVRTQH